MRTILSLLLLGVACMSQAAERNDIPSCYNFAKLEQHRPTDSGRELVLIVDQTVKVPVDLKKSIWNQVVRYVQPGDHVVMYQFSALLQDNYMKRVFDGKLEMPFTDQKVRNSLGMDSLKSLDGCLVQQTQFFAQTIGKKMAESFADRGDNIAKSEIMDSLKRIGDDLKETPASSKTVLLVSDMLENSAFGSFYSNNSIRLLEPEKELARASKQNLVADFGGANVYIAGAGLIDTDSKNNYRSGKIMQQLEAFWRQYFAASKATVVSFGAPELTVDLK
ncbi:MULTISPECIES: hypothetical protein [Pectobacterium]|uniref:Uncharacterized protein n=1 Tax=Pectobacterium odoriferum TaxID=78398 RepID=A0ABD6VUS3_9GAMM|nr:MULTISPECIES: hypothetical protein [Pectobacterium]AIU87124.1 hypothetical protein BCS7_02165 [Pectobacterium odoriferum]KGA36873.1 hypothetical protein KS43_11405 [Pectobacterium odoriferum]KGA41060.1 hypothetical protein KU75_13940 [Pectobacterium odoriferum]MBA0189720.1 hypothetical protein [Pectobacterium odoriferum]MCA6960866.1 hypothetical protein [Pectobacterium odoriferum]